MNLVQYPDAEFMMVEVADKLAGALEQSLFTQDRVSFAVPGGTTPGPVFDALCAASIDWSRVDVLLTDERRVPTDHDRSNTRLVRERLLTERAGAANFVSILDGALPVGILPITVLLLGMGADMHTASLFPGSPDLEAALSKTAPPLMKVDAPDGLEPRITLTAPVLSNAMSAHVLITGPEKRAALEKAARASLAEAPIRTVLNYATIHWAE